MINPLLEQFIQFLHLDLLLFKLLDDLKNLFETRLTGLYGTHDFLDERCLFGDLGKLMLDILKYFHWVVLSIEDFGHDIHVAFRNTFLIPLLLQISKGNVYCLFLPFLILSLVGLVANFILIFLALLF